MDLKIKDVAELLNVSETTIRRWLSEGKIPAYRIHHQYRFNRNEIENWVMGCKLSHPVDKIEAQPQEEVVSQGQRQYGLFRAVHHGEVYAENAATSKEGIIRETVARFAKKLDLDADSVSDLLLDREKLMPTALGNGVAVPHTRDFLLKGRTDAVIVLFLKTPMDWGALDGKLTHTLFFLFASNDKNHLHLLAKIAYLSSNPEALEVLKKAPSKETLLDFLKGWEGER